MERQNEMSRNELFAELRKHDLPTNGNRNILKSLLRKFYEDQAANVENNSVVGVTASIQQFDRIIAEKAEKLERLRQERLNRVYDEEGQHRMGDYQHGNVFANNSSRANLSWDSSWNVDGIANPGNIDRGNECFGKNVADLRRQSTNLFTFKNIENSMNTFCGSDSYCIDFFIDEFECNARMLHWNDDQKVVYAKRLLRGKVKFLIRTVFCSTWIDLKEELLKEFGNKLSNAEAHRLLQSSKMKQNDELGEHVLKMREFGKCNGIDETSVV